MRIFYGLINKKGTLTKRAFWCGMVCLLMSACISTKKITYFQPVSRDLDEAISKIEETYTPRIKEGDILSITVSSLNKEANEMFNPVTQILNYTTQAVGTIAPNPVLGYMVDATGNISLPILNNVPVKGLTSKELSVKLTAQLQQYLESPTVMVRIANYTVSVLGEVARPAVYTMPNEQITLPEALALAGDLTIYGKRKNILIIREFEGTRQFARIDLTNRDVFNSPFYYLRSGDVIYVEATSGKLLAIDRTYQLAPIIINSLTLAVLIITTFLK
ncbi:MAG: polysaccharide biosynthesis/export family protein [Prevotellaceae bacterium]|jgi:polysaccharide export outer membrane protein|nr:polysaccharide biosynthesis/export family protein [Prevotellaceae bacterium]